MKVTSGKTVRREYSRAREGGAETGFTLIEILIVIGMIAVLAAIVIMAINPGRQFAQARDTQRMSNVQSLLNAMGQRMADNRGVFDGTFAAVGVSYTCPQLAAGVEYEITSAIGPDKIDLSCLTPTYIPGGLPYDPASPGAHWTSSTDYETGYRVRRDAAGRITVSAPAAEVSPSILLTR